VSVRFFREKCTNFSCRTDRSERNKWLRYRQSTIDSACLNDIKKITKFGRFFKAVQRKNKNALNRYILYYCYILCMYILHI
jgi:exonuclease I